jgi:hypothetical protein
MRRRLMLQSLGMFVVAISLATGFPTTLTAQDLQAQGGTVLRRPIPARATTGSFDFARTELFFGTGRQDAPAVTEAEFLLFVDAQVTPRFPDGLTIIKADGQFRLSTGEIIKEESFVIVLLHPLEDFRESSRRINRIRRLYREQFQQESVLRVDDPFAVRVSF